MVYFDIKRRKKVLSHMKLNQIVIVSNIAEKQNYNPIVFLPCPAGQDTGRKKFDESFFEQSRAGPKSVPCGHLCYEYNDFSVDFSPTMII